jgi:hypothetical protein
MLALKDSFEASRGNFLPLVRLEQNPLLPLLKCCFFVMFKGFFVDKTIYFQYSKCSSISLESENLEPRFGSQKAPNKRGNFMSASIKNACATAYHLFSRRNSSRWNFG